jgi:hypothetical protein
LVQEVEPADVSAPERLHHPGQRLNMTRRSEQVHVIVHQDIGVDRHVVRARRVVQAVEIEQAIGDAREHRRTIVAALDDVQRGAGVVEARLTGHAASVHRLASGRHRPKVVSDPISARKSSLTLFSVAIFSRA